MKLYCESSQQLCCKGGEPCHVRIEAIYFEDLMPQEANEFIPQPAPGAQHAPEPTVVEAGDVAEDVPEKLDKNHALTKWCKERVKSLPKRPKGGWSGHVRLNRLEWPGMTVPVEDMTVGLTLAEVVPSKDMLMLQAFAGMPMMFWDQFTFCAWVAGQPKCRYCCSALNVESKGWCDHVILMYSVRGVEGLIGKRWEHEGCPNAKPGCNSSTWNSYDPEWVASQAEPIRDHFNLYFTPGGVALKSCLSNQLAASGTHLTISAYSEILMQTSQDNELDKKLLIVHHCTAYNKRRAAAAFGGTLPASVEPSTYKASFLAADGLRVRSASAKYLGDQFNRGTEEETEYLVDSLNSVVCDIIIIDWTFDVASRIKVDGETIALCQLNIRAGFGNMMHTSMVDTPSVSGCRSELTDVARRCREAGCPVVGIVVDDEKFEALLYEIYHEANPAFPGGLGCRLGFFHACQRIGRTLRDCVGKELFLHELSNALKFRDAQSQNKYVQQVTRREKHPLTIEVLRTKSSAWWNKNTAVLRFYRVILKQHGAVWDAYQKYKSFGDGDGLMCTDGAGGTECAIMKFMHLILDGWYQHFPGKPTHLNRAAPGKIADYIVCDSESPLEAVHRQERRVLRDSKRYGPVHASNKILRFFGRHNWKQDVLNKLIPNLGTPRGHKVIAI